jgi:hypothetical protein
MLIKRSGLGVGSRAFNLSDGLSFVVGASQRWGANLSVGCWANDRDINSLELASSAIAVKWVRR